MASSRLLNKPPNLVINKFLHPFRSVAVVAPWVVSPRSFTTKAQIRHSEDIVHRRDSPSNFFSGLINSIGLVVPGENPDSETRRLLLPAVLESKFYTYNNDIFAHNIPVPHRYHCCGSHFGWLFLVDDSLDIHLYNPLSGSKIQLPSVPPPVMKSWCVERFGRCFVNKAFLSCEPVPSSLSQTYVLVVYGGGNMLVCKLGDKAWTEVLEYDGKGRYDHYVDAVYYKEKFYVVCCDGYLMTVDFNANIDHSTLTVHERTPIGKSNLNGFPRYLVESKGELFLVKRHVKYDINEDEDEGEVVSDEDYGDGGDAEEDVEDKSDDGNEVVSGDGGDGEKDIEDSSDDEVKCPNCGGKLVSMNDMEWSRYYRTIDFEIFKLRDGDWEKVESIGDRAFFVGKGGSFSVSASDFQGYRPNAIYYTDNKHREIGWPEAVGHDIGVFNLEEKTVEHIYPIDSKPVSPYPFWFAPLHG